MLNHYYDISPISQICDAKIEYKKQEIEFGKSNTDQSYYQPIGSQVASMVASSSMQHLHNGAEQSIKEIFENASFVPNYMTNEELAHAQKLSEQRVQQAQEDIKKQYQEIRDNLQTEVNTQKIVNNSTDNS